MSSSQGPINVRVISQLPAPDHECRIEHLSLSTTVGALKGRISQSLASAPRPGHIILIYAGHFLVDDRATLQQVFNGPWPIQPSNDTYSMHMVLRSYPGDSTHSSSALTSAATASDNPPDGTQSRRRSSSTQRAMPTSRISLAVNNASPSARRAMEDLRSAGIDYPREQARALYNRVWQVVDNYARMPDYVRHSLPVYTIHHPSNNPQGDPITVMIIDEVALDAFYERASAAQPGAPGLPPPRGIARLNQAVARIATLPARSAASPRPQASSSSSPTSPSQQETPPLQTATTNSEPAEAQHRPQAASTAQPVTAYLLSDGSESFAILRTPEGTYQSASADNSSALLTPGLGPSERRNIERLIRTENALVAARQEIAALRQANATRNEQNSTPASTTQQQPVQPAAPSQAGAAPAAPQDGQQRLAQVANQLNNVNLAAGNRQPPAGAMQAHERQDNVDIVQLIGQVFRHLWVMVRVFGVIWLITRGTSTQRTVLIVASTAFYLAFQAGVFGERPFERLRGWFERVLDRQQAREGGNQGLWQRVEQSFALFLASLYPGVGERRIAALNRAVREGGERGEGAEGGEN